MKELPIPTLGLSSVALPRGSLHPRPVVQPVPAFHPQPQPEASHGISVGWARHLDEVREAQRLRYAVFAGEMGATLPNTLPGHDVDLFDDFCEHLLVRDQPGGQVIGT